MSFSFDTSHSPIVRNTDSSNNEPTIHPALQSNPMAHQSKPHHSSSPEHINTSTIPLHQQSQMSGDHNDPRMYAIGLKEQDKHQPEQVQQSSHQHNEQHEQQIQHEASNQSRMSSMYNSSKDSVSAMQSRNVLSDNNHQSYNNQQQQQQQQRQQQHGLFIHQTPSPPDPHGHLERPL
jgi:hypothetical protein